MFRLKVLLLSFLMLFMAGSGAALQNVPDTRDLRFRELPAAFRLRDYDVCVVSMAGRFFCMRKQQLRDRLVSLDGRDRDLILGLLDRLNASVGNRTVNDMLVHCIGEWRGVRTPGLGAGSISSGPPRQSNDALERQLTRVRTDAMRNACTAGTPAGVRTGGIGAARTTDYDRQAASVVAGFDEAMASCQDRGNSPVAQYSPGGRFDEIRLAWEIERHDYRPLVRLLDQLNEALAPLAEAARAAQAAETSRKLAEEQAALDLARAEAARSPEEQEAKQCLEATQCTEPGSQTRMPLPPGEGGGASCAEKQARWNGFKDRCERSRWQSYECVAFVRRLQGCVDITRIQPGPDGDLTCPVSQTQADRDEIRVQQQCRKVGLIGQPRPDGGGFQCGLRPAIAPPDRRIDVCRDPRVTPEPGRCPG